jgi:hypothetical protein
MTRGLSGVPSTPDSSGITPALETRLTLTQPPKILAESWGRTRVRLAAAPFFPFLLPIYEA